LVSFKYALLKEIDLFYEECGITVPLKYRIMPPRLLPLCDFNNNPRPNENGEGELPPPPPPLPYNDGIHPALVQFIADSTRHLFEAIS
jgi:hypothetical protein